jgi:NitT/TauT family transport system substrate-binding protein
VDHQQARIWSRREFLGKLTPAGTAGFLSFYPKSSAAEPPPETMRLRLGQGDGICYGAPLLVAEEFLHIEGFNEVQYVPGGAGPKSLDAGEIDLTSTFLGVHLRAIAAGDPIVFLAGLHVGCFELFGIEEIRTVRDLKGRTMGVTRLGSGRHLFAASLLAYVGLDPHKDVTWVTHPPAQAIGLLAKGELDAFMAFPPEPQELRAKKIGHVMVNTTIDRPWSHYFCCMIAARQEFVRTYPMATKRALRAILKGIDVCAIEPARSTQLLMDKGIATNYDYALQSMQEIPYGKWREYDPEDTVRFYALRLHEAGMIQTGPQTIITQGADWRFLNELKKELKG